MQYDINLKIMGQRIKESRLKLGLTQEQLAEIVNLSVPHLSKSRKWPQRIIVRYGCKAC